MSHFYLILKLNKVYLLNFLFFYKHFFIGLLHTLSYDFVFFEAFLIASSLLYFNFFFNFSCFFQYRSWLFLLLLFGSPFVCQLLIFMYLYHWLCSWFTLVFFKLVFRNLESLFIILFIVYKTVLLS